MFARPGRSIFICFGCQSRLAEQTQSVQRPTPVDRTSRQSQKRWQSTAVAVAEDPQYHEDDRGYPRPKPQSEKRYKSGKVWKPNQTAQLGVSSLGKPAEVLLLNERDRLLPKALADTEEDREGNVLAAAWSTETQSLSAEQLTKNIEHIRDQARLESEEHSEGRRASSRKRLQEGFSSKQLRNYIEQKQDQAAKPWRWKRDSFPVKAQMARHIFKHIWRINGSDMADATVKTEMTRSRQVQMSATALEVLLLADNSSLRHIAENYRVKIDFYRQPSKIIVSGSPSSVDAARESLLHWQKKVIKYNIGLEACVKVGEQEDDPTLFAEIRRQYNVHVVGRVGPAGRKQAIQICYHEDTPPDLAAIRRYVLLAQRPGPLLSRCTVWPKISSEENYRVFLGQPGRRWNGSGKRLVTSSERLAAPSVPQMSADQKSTFSEIYKASREALNFSSSTRLMKVAAGPGVRIAHRASFGQALVDDDANGTMIMLTPISDRALHFTSQIPLLPQFLARRKPWKDDAPSEALKMLSESALPGSMGELSSPNQSPQFMYELTLSSASSAPSTTTFPPLKIQLVGADVSLGLRQPLQISAISAILAEKNAYLLLPSQAVDIKYENQILRDVYREGNASDPTHATLLSQLAKYFEAAGSLADPKFAPFTMLNIPSDLQTLRIRSKISDSPHEYVLESATALDVASYRPPFLSKLCLEHVVFLGDNHGEGRQVLQLSDSSRLSAPSKQKTTSRFAGFFNSAYEIARLLGNSALLLPSKKS